MARVFENDKGYIKDIFMNVLIFGTLNHQHIQNFARSLKEELGYKLYGVNNNPRIRSNYEYDTVKIFENYCNVKRLDSFLDVIYKFFSSIICFCKICDRRIDIVQFHYVSLFVFPLLLLAKLKKKKTSVFVYGSDILRTGNLFHKYCNVVFWFADSVVCDSTTLCDKLKKDFPRSQLKIECVLFGSTIIDKLGSLKKDKLFYKSKLNIPIGYTCLMCGYNAAKEQNHIKVLSALEGMQHQLYIVVPMTYNGTKEYISNVERWLKDHNWNYRILDTFVDDVQWCEYTVATDIFVHMQQSDAFSSSLAEHLYMGNIVINAKWLEYADLKKESILYFESTFEELLDVAVDILANYEKYYSLCVQNQKSIESMKSLKYTVINYWGPYFTRLFQK